MATMYFVGNNAAAGLELWAVQADGGIGLVADLQAGSGSSLNLGGGSFTSINGVMYLTANTGSPSSVSNVYQMSGGTPVAITNFAAHPTMSSGAGGVFSFNGGAYFLHRSASSVTTLYSISGGSATALGVVSNGVASNYPGGFTEYDGKLYYSALTKLTGGGNDYKLWSIGPSGNGALAAAPTDFALDGLGGGFVKFAGNLYVVGGTAAQGDELYKISPGGALTLLKEFAAGSAPGLTAFALASGKEFKGEYYFAADSTAEGVELWKIKGDGSVALVADINPGSVDSNPFIQRAVEFNGELYFSADKAGFGTELWKINAAGAAVLAKDVVAGATGSSALPLAVFNNALYFTATTAANGNEVWKIDAAGNASMVKDFNPDAASSNANFATIYNGALFLSVSNANKRELWKIDSTGAATFAATLNPDGVDSYGQVYQIFNGNLYFKAYSLAHGSELWRMNPAGAVTELEIYAGNLSGLPNSNFFIFPPVVADAPTDIALSVSTVLENRANGTVVGALSAIDPDAGETFTYALLDNAGGRFAIVGNQLRVANGLLIDFEQAAAHNITVRVTDSDGHTYDKIFTITVGNVAAENVSGDAGANTLVGGGGNDSFSGGGGGDFLFSNSFNADGTMKTGAGNDTLNGGDGDDGLFGGDGNDTLNGDADNDGMVGGAGNDFMNGGAGNDFLFGGGFTTAGAFAPNSGADTLNGGDGNDGLYGFDGADTINGDAGNDYVEGGAGNDIINGGAGSDYLLGQDEADTITGGTGFDYLYGGAGGDAFIFRKGDSADWILDFSAAQGDKLRFLDFGYASFSAVPLVDLSSPGNPAVQFTFSGPGGVDQLTVFGVSLAQLNATNVLVA